MGVVSDEGLVGTLRAASEVFTPVTANMLFAVSEYKGL